MAKSWGTFSEVNAEKDGMLSLSPSNEFHLKLLIPPGVSYLKAMKIEGEPWSKYFEYDKKTRVVNYVENRAVDALPICLSKRAVYLIRRKKDGGLAIPGGYYSDIDGIEATAKPSKIGRYAAVRELKEETNFTYNPNFLTYIGKFRENINKAFPLAPREVNTYTWAFAAAVDAEQMGCFSAGDDAEQAEGDTGIPGWYSYDGLKKLQMTFFHHQDIINAVLVAVGDLRHNGPRPEVERAIKWAR